MSDLRKQLRKAGLVTDKQLRQAKHKDRVHASEVGHEGIAAEKKAEEERLRAEREERKRADRKREEERKRQEKEAAASQRLARVIQRGWIREATAGSRRFFFETPSGRISFLDLSDVAARRVSSGSAAIVETAGTVRGEFCVVGVRAAQEIGELRPELIRVFNRDGSGRA
jgi:uncharacterized protein YaiL (DUF2058 family)